MGGAVVPEEIDVDWRALLRLLRPAGTAGERSADAGSGSGQGTPDGDEVRWKQTRHGSNSARWCSS
eukprot:5700303-Pyramimonas_sp.AAC.1